ncbi:MAG: CBS domain-containing protein [Burkholderiales bacterium]|nr:CBS domain-containing protein [Burkholderiales bacterium]
MTRDYTALTHSTMQSGVSYAQPTQPVPEKVTVDDPALQVLTDFKRVTAIIVLAGDTVDEAHSRMIKRSVRLLLVVNQERKVVGVITANDILGEKIDADHRPARNPA